MHAVSKSFRSRHGHTVTAARSVDLSISAGETVAIVGESGSGKSTIARIALGLLRPDQGRVELEGQDLARMSGDRLRAARRSVQPVFQDPAAALNPRHTVLKLISQAIMLTSRSSQDPLTGSITALESVGLSPGRQYLGRYPHELSGGQKQRLAIARALAARPRLIIADEPLSGADVSMRGHILNLLMDLQKARGLGYLFITHDISIARAFAHRVVVMHLGQVVEAGSPDEVIGKPRHDYTRKLIASVPLLDP